jgi:hypothetical protein
LSTHTNHNFFGASVGTMRSYGGRFENRFGTGITYYNIDNGFGASLAYTKFGGTDPQSNWQAGIRYKDAYFKIANDVWISGDKYRTAAAEIGWREFSIGFNVYTNAPVEKKDLDMEYTSTAVKKYDGHNIRRHKGKLENNGAYPDGYRISSPLYFGYKRAGGMYRIGIDAPWVQDNTQNRLHRIIGSPFIKSGEGTSLYTYYRSYDLFSLSFLSD